MGKGRIRISFARLREALCLPGDTEIDTVVVAQEYEEIRIFVRHPGIAPVDEATIPGYVIDGAMIRDVSPKFAGEYPDQNQVVIFDHWGYWQ